MKIKFIENKTLENANLLIIGLFKNGRTDTLAGNLDSGLSGVLASVNKEKTFFQKPFETRVIYTPGSASSKKVLFVSLGEEGDFSLERLRKAAGITASIVEKLGEAGFTSLLYAQARALNNEWLTYDISFAVTEAVMMALYSFECYKTEKDFKKGSAKEAVLFMAEKDPEAVRGARDAVKLSEAVFTARDLVNHPGNTATPSFLAKEAKRISLKAGITCKILGEKEAFKLGMGAFLGVAKGSCEPPKFIVLEYFGGLKKEKPVVFVGKGLTFDSGGISLKPSEKMEEMKFDMAGGAAAIGAIQAIASLKLKVNVVSLIPATENMPGGRANKPGDILKAMSGTTIEVINTDAEGRLILADALCYAERYKPRAVIDLATLTGACIVALGHHATAVLGNDEELIGDLIAAGEKTGERLWELPLWEEFDEQIKSTIADIKNTGGRSGGTITAAAFLKNFGSKYRWAHLDIAGTAWEEKGRPCVPSGATGVGVRLLFEFIKRQL
ncbi:MAG: leucyl aminopeptidase [Nitrospinota bacterium]